MCYVIAKDVNGFGCVAVKMKAGKMVVDLKREIIAVTGHSRIQLVTISRPSAYREYAPYQIMDTVDKFKEAVFKM